MTERINFHCKATISLIYPQAAQTLFVIYIRDSIALRFELFKLMYENGSKIALNSACSTSVCACVILKYLWQLSRSNFVLKPFWRFKLYQVWKANLEKFSAARVRAQIHSRPQRPRSFWSAPRIATSGPVQLHSSFEWICKHNRLRPEPIRSVKLFSEQAQSDGRSVNGGLPLLDLARSWGHDSWSWPKGARPLGTRMAQIQTGSLGCVTRDKTSLVVKETWGHAS